MFTELMASGSGGGGYAFIDDITNIECVAAVNPNGTSRNLSISNIPKTQNVVYALASQGYATSFVVGRNYNLKSFSNPSLIVIDDNGISIDLSTMNYTLSGSTLSTSQSAAYTNYGLFVIGEK